MLAVVFDTETTNLTTNRLVKLDAQPYIIEFAALTINLADDQVLEQFTQLIKPPKPLPDQPPFGTKKTITEITGIDNAMLTMRPTFAEVAPKIKDILESAHCAIAHNFTFDQEMVDIEFERLNQSIKWPTAICTVEATVHLKGKRLTLAELYGLLFNTTFKDAHRALADAQATARCAIELFQRGLI